MATLVALLRAVNVGGTGRLAMADLRAMCLDAGFTRVETYIASGNVVLDSRSSATAVKAELERRLLVYAGKSVGVAVRSSAAMARIVAANPFATAEAKHSYVIFLDEPPPADTLSRTSGRSDEEIRLGAREIFVHYPGGMGRSKLRIPAARTGTARNMNTVVRLAEMAARS